MRVAVIGAGSIGAIAIMECLSRNIDTVCFYDPSVPHLGVGESGTNSILKQMFNVLDFSVVDDMKELDATMRWGTKYFWEKANDKKFVVNYHFPGLHFNSAKFSSWVIEKCKIKFDNFSVIPEKVNFINNRYNDVEVSTETKNYKFDYVIDCSGYPTKEKLLSSEYSEPRFSGVNSVLLHLEHKRYDEEYTSSIVHENGWMFGVPLQHRKAWGYLFNDKYTTREEAQKGFSNIKNIDVEKLKCLNWNQYFKKEAVEERVLYLGNKLYFFEPHQAIPLHYSFTIMREFFNSMLNRHDSEHVDYMNNFHQYNMNLIQDLIALNYCGENKMETPFWNFAKNKSLQVLQTSKFSEWCDSCFVDGELNYLNFWNHGPRTMREYFEGYDIDINKIRGCAPNG